MHTAVVNVRAKSWYVSTQKEHILCTLLLKKKKQNKWRALYANGVQLTWTYEITYLNLWLWFIISLEGFTQHSVCWTLRIIGFIEVTQPNRFFKVKNILFWNDYNSDVTYMLPNRQVACLGITYGNILMAT